MRDTAPVATARDVAVHRLACRRPAAPFGDAHADERLARDLGPAAPPTAALAGYLRAHTAFFDRAVLSALERGCTQVVLLGAGYDGRALRYAAPGVRWFELDDPAVQRDKRARLDRLEIPTPGVTFVPADATREDVAAVLLRAGFAPDSSSLLVCESSPGPVVLAVLLGQLRSLATPGTRLALATAVPGRAAVPAAAAAPPEPGPPKPGRLEPGPTVAGDPAGADPVATLAAARWRPAAVSERSQRAGLMIGIPVWEPGRPPTAGHVGAYLERTFSRVDLDGLPAHLADTYGIPVIGTERLDVGVVRVGLVDGRRWIARVFPAARPLATTRRDAQTLARLADAGFPAERAATSQPVSEHHGQAVLVTDCVDGQRPRPTRATFDALGALLGRLHTWSDAPRRPGGAWHHLALDGGPDAEVAALRALLDARRDVPPPWRTALAELDDEVDRLDTLADLPSAFTHPDLAPPNVIGSTAGDLTVVDWAGAGVAPRLWSLGFLLWAAGQAGPSHVRAAAQGYRRHVRPDAAELARLEPAVAARPLVFEAWSWATGRRPLPEVVEHRPATRAAAREIAAQARAAFDA